MLLMHGYTGIAFSSFRCFGEEQLAEMRPITLLVGDNSSGKTSFLGGCQVLDQILTDRVIDFNEAPFTMGAFNDVVYLGKGSQFKVGHVIESNGCNCCIKHTVVKQHAENLISSIGLSFAKEEFLDLRFIGFDQFTVLLPDGQSVEMPVERFSLNSPVRVMTLLVQAVLLLVIEPRSNRADFDQFIESSTGFNAEQVRILYGKLKQSRITADFEKFFEHIIQDVEIDDERDALHLRRRIREVFSYRATTSIFRAPSAEGGISSMKAFSPVRSEPKRTYEPINGVRTPEGEHIPMLLRGLKHGKPKQWERMHSLLSKFGKDSGLFSDIDIKDLGSVLEPFQIRFSLASSRQYNIVDVGYGISQLLPILVEIFLGRRRGLTFMLQQPEVHLHPSGQAALASLLVESCRFRDNSFVVETHSDYIINRVRIEVKKGNISPDDVSLVFFSRRKRKGVKIDNMQVDKYGNILKAPENYRKFFLKEMSDLLGD